MKLLAFLFVSLGLCPSVSAYCLAGKDETAARVAANLKANSIYVGVVTIKSEYDEAYYRPQVVEPRETFLGSTTSLTLGSAMGRGRVRAFDESRFEGVLGKPGDHKLIALRHDQYGYYEDACTAASISRTGEQLILQELRALQPKAAVNRKQ